MYCWDGKATFSAAITSVFSVTYTSEIILIFWFGAWKIFIIIIINVEKSCAGQNFLWKLMHLFQNCCIINVFTVTYEFNGSLLYETINVIYVQTKLYFLSPNRK